MTAPQYEPLTPVETERQVRWISNEMSRARVSLMEARNEEVAAKHVYERTRRRAILSGGCPRVTRGGHTVLDRDAWVDEQCAPVREAYELAEVKRKAAEEHLRTLYQQGMLAATLAKSVHQAYAMAGAAA